MIYIKNEILEFLRTNSDTSQSICRYIKRIDAIDFELVFEKAAYFDIPVFYYSKPSKDYSMLCIDSLEKNICEKYFSCIMKDGTDLFSGILSNKSWEMEPAIPLFVGGMKFTPDKKESIWISFENETWFIPKIILIKNKDSFYLVFNSTPLTIDFTTFDFILQILTSTNVETKNCFPYNFKTSSDNIREWIQKITVYLDVIKKGMIEKAVLARRVEIKLKNDFSIADALINLKNKYTGCTTFAYEQGKSIFFGSTPEILFSLNNNELKTEAVAGSIKRGGNNADDLFLENALLNNPKELNEHDNVVKYIQNKLTPFAEEMSFDKMPKIKKLKNIQHLQTSFHVKLKSEINILDVVKSLHPTSAVCGFPQAEAFKLIDEVESFDRGMYAGVLGWFDEKQSGEFVVGIRSALIHDSILYAYAGCGIVEGSDPISEYNETELKLKPILSLLNNETIG